MTELFRMAGNRRWADIFLAMEGDLDRIYLGVRAYS